MGPSARRDPINDQDGEYNAIDNATQSLLVLSDSEACNENFSKYIKHVIDDVYLKEPRRPPFQLVSRYALKLLKLNLYTKNYEFCTAKMLAFLSTFSSMEPPTAYLRLEQEQNAIKEFLCVILLLLLRLKNSTSDLGIGNSVQEDLSIVCPHRLYDCLRKHDFVRVIADFISVTAVAANEGTIDHVLLKLSGEIFFEYLLSKTSLSDAELQCLSRETNLIQVLIRSTLNSDGKDTYRIDRDDIADEMELIAYEEFKLLLLINEQYLMLHYTGGKQTNMVFEVLLEAGEDTQTLPITHFLNALIYNLNKEESLIIKTLILKFLYQVFTTSFTAKLVYLNDLKILVDVVLRELSNLEYHENNAYVFVAYLKVLFPLLLFSQLNEASCHYKKQEILRVMRSIAIGMSDEPLILELAVRCLSVPWIHEKPPKDLEVDLLLSSHNSESNDAESTCLSEKYLGSSSIEGISLNRSYSRKDFHKQGRNQGYPSERDHDASNSTGRHDFIDQDTPPTNHAPKNSWEHGNTPTLNYLLPQTPSRICVVDSNGFFTHTDSSSLLIGSGSRLQRKAVQKKAPPPPPTTVCSPRLDMTPPPPPPPRRRRP